MNEKPESAPPVLCSAWLGRWLDNSDALLTIASCGFWIVMAISSVHKLRTPPPPDSEYGWLLPLAMCCVVLPPAIFAYRWGASKRPNDKAQRPGT